MEYRSLFLIGTFFSASPMFAQAVGDPSVGWGSLILQAGAFGLLTYIVIVLYPKQQKDVREERERRDDVFKSMLDTLQTKFEDRNREIVSALKEQTDSIVTEMHEDAKMVRELIANKIEVKVK